MASLTRAGATSQACLGAAVTSLAHRTRGGCAQRPLGDLVLSPFASHHRSDQYTGGGRGRLDKVPNSKSGRRFDSVVGRPSDATEYVVTKGAHPTSALFAEERSTVTVTDSRRQVRPSGVFDLVSQRINGGRSRARLTIDLGRIGQAESFRRRVLLETERSRYTPHTSTRLEGC